jgi:hypothetical protein
MCQRHGFTEYDLEHILDIPDQADTWQSYKAEYDLESVLGTQSYEITLPNAMPTQPR